MRSKIFMALVVTCVLILGLNACDETPDMPLRVGTNVWPGYEPGYLARDLKYYSDKEVRLHQFQSATESIRGFRSGAVDIAALTLDEALLLVQDGVDIRIFLVADVSHGGDVIVAKPAIKSVQGLAGKRVGVESSALGAYVLARALEIHNVPFENVELRHLTVDESEQAFSNGDLDAVVTFEPYRSRLMREGAHEIFSSREMPNEIVDVLVVRADFAEKHQDQLRAFSTAWLKAVDFIQNKPDKAAALIGRRLRLSPEEAKNSFDGLVLPDMAMNRALLSDENANSLVVGAEKLAQVLVKHKLLGQSVSVKGRITDAYVQP